MRVVNDLIPGDKDGRERYRADGVAREIVGKRTETNKRKIGWLVEEKAARYGSAWPPVISTFGELPKGGRGVGVGSDITMITLLKFAIFERRVLDLAVAGRNV